MTRKLILLVPGDLATLTGGYIYDRRMMEALTLLGWQVSVRALSSGFPYPDAAALDHANAVLAALPDQSLVMIDGLALGAMPVEAHRHADRLRLVALVHHPLARETGLPTHEAARLLEAERRALRAVRQIVVTSSATATALDDYGVMVPPVVVEPGCDPAPLAPRRGLAGDGCNLLCVASLTERKGHELLIEALAGLKALPWKLICVGNLTRAPAVVARVRRLLLRHGLSARVSLVGEVSERGLKRHYLAADLFVLATLYEGYGMVVAEALSFGLPVVATDTGAISHLIAGQAGILVPAGNGVALAAALRDVLSLPALRATHAIGAEARRATLPGWPEQARILATALERVGA